MDHILAAREALEESRTQRVTMKAEQAAELIGCSYWLLLRMCQQKKIPFIKCGNRYLFRKDSLIRWMDNQEVTNMLNESESECYGQLKKVK